MDWLTILQTAKLPAVAASVDEFGHVQASFERPLAAAEWQTFLDLTNPAQARHERARGEAKLATALRTCTPAQAVDYINSSVTDLASAKAALRIMARMLIALRDHAWPELPDEA